MDALRHDLRAPTRWPVLDGVRGLAVISVVLYHALRLLVLGETKEQVQAFSAAWWPVATGRLALDAFFVLSGFLIVESWRSVRERHDGLWTAVSDYARRRAMRILPAYWVSLAVLVPLIAPHLFRSPGDLALLAGVQQYLRPGLPSEVNVVYWSLTTEVHFYVLAPVVVVALRRFGIRPVLLASLVAAVGWQVIEPGGLPKSLVIGRLDQFALGAALAGVVRDRELGVESRVVRLVERKGAGVALVAALVALGAWQGAVLAGQATAASALLHPAVGIVMAGLLLRFLTSARVTIVEHPALRLAGLVSYGVYLCHYPILAYGYEWARLGPASLGSIVVATAVTLGLVIASFVIGGASYVLVERPFLRRKVPASSPQPAPVAVGPPLAGATTRTLAPWPMTAATSTTSSSSSA